MTSTKQDGTSMENAFRLLHWWFGPCRLKFDWNSRFWGDPKFRTTKPKHHAKPLGGTKLAAGEGIDGNRGGNL